MKKYFFLFLAAMMSLTFVACGDDEDETGKGSGKETSIVGEWSGVRSLDQESVKDIYIHYSFKSNGTFVMTMPAWEEQRSGSYTVDGNKLTMLVKELSWVRDRENGYKDVYDQYDSANYEDWANKHQDEVVMNATYKFDNNGTLTINNATFGLELIFFSDPKFDPNYDPFAAQ